MNDHSSDSPQLKDQDEGLNIDGMIHQTRAQASVLTTPPNHYPNAPFALHEENDLDRVLSIRTTFGFDVVLVPVALGEKRPTVKGWTDFEIGKMGDVDYLSQIEKGNIAILTGPKSGNLVSIDLDDDASAEQFRLLNRELCSKTIVTRGARGCNFWLRINGEYPTGPQKIRDADGRAVGELRAGGCITVVEGKHPIGVPYSREGVGIAYCTFKEILWPTDWMLPWIEDPFDELVEKEGHPFVAGPRGGIQLNQPALVQKFTQEHIVLHDPGLGFYEYDSHTGVWLPQTKEAIMKRFSEDIKTLADEATQPEILTKRNSSLLGSLAIQLAGAVEERNAFAKRSDPIIHVKNGMLRVSAEGVEIAEFDPSFRSLGQIPVCYNPDAICPRFLNDLLRHALPENDILLLQKYAGQVLLGTNLSQTFLILEGEGGAGKGQIGVVIDGIIGSENVAELRTAHLSGRFELKSFVGKKLLAGRDVSGDFLNLKGAGTIKKLTGGDPLTVESKGKDERSNIVGDFNMTITTNTRLVVALEGDKGAWKRRLLIISFVREAVEKPIVGFGKMLVEEEGEGILAWMVEGAQLLLHDLREHGRIQLDATQRKRVHDLLAESDSIMAFVTRRLVRENGSSVATFRLVQAFEDFCENNDMPTVPRKQFERRLRSEMLQAHQAISSENISTSSIRCRGYLGVRLLNDDDDDIDTQGIE